MWFIIHSDWLMVILWNTEDDMFCRIWFLWYQWILAGGAVYLLNKIILVSLHFSLPAGGRDLLPTLWTRHSSLSGASVEVHSACSIHTWEESISQKVLDNIICGWWNIAPCCPSEHSNIISGYWNKKLPVFHRYKTCLYRMINATISLKMWVDIYSFWMCAVAFSEPGCSSTSLLVVLCVTSMTCAAPARLTLLHHRLEKQMCSHKLSHLFFATNVATLWIVLTWCCWDIWIITLLIKTLKSNKEVSALFMSLLIQPHLNCCFTRLTFLTLEKEHRHIISNWTKDMTFK